VKGVETMNLTQAVGTEELDGMAIEAAVGTVLRTQLTAAIGIYAPTL
jgi:hypothetical protein